MTNQNQTANQRLLDYSHISPDSLGCRLTTTDRLPRDIGFFQFGVQVCYGRCQSGTTPDVAESRRFDALKDVLCDGATLQVPFSFSEVVDNLRLERYRENMVPRREVFARSELIRKLYYLIRGGLPASVRRQLQKAYFSDREELPFPAWPVDFTVEQPSPAAACELRPRLYMFVVGCSMAASFPGFEATPARSVRILSQRHRERHFMVLFPKIRSNPRRLRFRIARSWTILSRQPFGYLASRWRYRADAIGCISGIFQTPIRNFWAGTGASQVLRDVCFLLLTCVHRNHDRRARAAAGAVAYISMALYLTKT
jgi:hypothetical protein